MFISLAFSEVNAGFFYKSAEDREKLVKAERQHTDKKVQQIIDLKKQVCEGNNKGFVVINQKVCHSLPGYDQNKDRQDKSQSSQFWPY